MADHEPSGGPTERVIREVSVDTLDRLAGLQARTLRRLLLEVMGSRRWRWRWYQGNHG